MRTPHQPARSAQILRDRREEMVSAWEEAVRGSPVARPAEPSLRDGVPSLLDRVESEILGKADERKDRGRVKTPHDLDFRAVLAALRVLRGCVLDAWAADDGSLDVASVRALDRTLDDAAEDAARRVAETHAALLRGVDAISRASIESRSVDELLARLLDAFIAASCDVTTVTVFLRERDELRVRATLGLAGVERGMTFRIGEGLPGTAAAEGRPPTLRSGAAGESRAWSDVIRDSGVRATYGVPLVHDGEIIGVAHMGSTRVDAFPREELGLFESMASRAGLGIARHVAADEARSALRERREAQVLLEALFESAPVGLGFWDRELRFVRVNRWLADANGLPVEAHIGRTPRELLPALEGLDAMMARLREIVETGRPWIGAEITGETPARPGERRAWREDIFPVRMGGEIVGLGAVILDVTEELRANDELSLLARLSRDFVVELELDPRLRRAVEIAVPAFADWCALVTLERGAPRHAAVAGADREMAARARELLERVPLDLGAARGVGRVLREGEPELIADVDAMPAGEPALPNEIQQMLRKLGIRSYLSVPLRGEAGVVGALCFGTAAGRRFDERSLRFAVELARRISLALENARLFEAARREAMVREQVLAVVSHDLRTPLATILMSTRRIEAAAPAGSDGDALRRTAETVRRAAGRMERLIGDLLDVAAIQGGSLSVAPEPRPPGDLLHEAADAMSSIARERGISFEIDVSPGMPRVLADRDRILQVLANLVSNALKVTPPGGKIGVRAEIHEGAVRFAVSDTGPGIPPEERPQLFEPYQRGVAAEYQGAGLGLAIARGIVAAHGGSIDVESEPGAGATFWFTLPIALEEEAALRH
jgi:PAS domain S-box-containing protein